MNYDKVSKNVERFMKLPPVLLSTNKDTEEFRAIRSIVYGSCTLKHLGWSSIDINTLYDMVSNRVERDQP